MVKVTISGVFGVDGEYDLDTDYFTNRELHKIKQLTGVRAGELTEAINAGDSDLIVALASIALARNSKQVPDDALWEAPAGKIMIESVEEPVEGDALPPENSGAESSSGSEKSEPSGPTSNVTGDSPVSDPSPTGIPV